MFQKYFLSRNTLFIHFMCCAEAVDDFFLDEALVSVFEHDAYLHQVVLLVPPQCPEDVLHCAGLKRRNVYKYCAKRIDDIDSCHYLYTFTRLEFCPKLKMRRAVEEDNDDIVEILDKKCPRLKDLYGHYYVSKLIGRHPESNRKIIVADHQDRAVGVMCLNSDINYEKLDATYDLGPLYGLKRATPLEKEECKRANPLLKTFG
ncbi:cilia- and flagella-associated protein 61 [Ostrinia nubilalis]|uniref:cilia- and flagella-associated protein 61 n=1 Tax=Ostrinia nubilalis TaxID=29057 RepID=UPI00308267E5